jgi:UDP-N-acetylmuramyl pentapeptide phosphotransferase/UDP-N-acetylglucosamine-1-phosphate transferase
MCRAILKYARSPYFIGAMISVFIFAAIWGCIIWAPQVLDSRNRWWAELIAVSSSILLILMDQFWSFRKHPRFWGGLAALVVANAIIVIRFISSVRELALWHYSLIIFCEVLGGSVFLDWCVYSGKRNHRKLTGHRAK